MALWKPDPTFYPSPKMAMQAPPERLAYVAVVEPTTNGRPDAMAVVDVDPRSPTYSQMVGRVEMAYPGDELHHFGWNACSAALCPYAPHPHVERRYLVVPGIRSSRIYILDTKPDPTQPHIVKVIEPQEVKARSGYSSPHTVHCGPDAIYVSALGSPSGDGPGGILMLDHDNFDVLGRWEMDRGPQYLAYDFWWHLGQDTLVTSEWGTPNMVEHGVQPEVLLKSGYGHQLHLWDLRRRRHLQALDLGAEQQMVLELRPAHDPTKAYGFAGVVVSLKDLSGSVWVWHRDADKWAVRKVIEIPAEPADPAKLPPLLKDFKAVPPLITDLNPAGVDPHAKLDFGGETVSFNHLIGDILALAGRNHQRGTLMVGTMADNKDHTGLFKRALAMASLMGKSRSRSSIPHSPDGLTSKNTKRPSKVSIRSTAPNRRPSRRINCPNRV